MIAIEPRIIVALDVAEPDAALNLAQILTPNRCRLKVGNELFTRAGPALVETLIDRGFDVFLDLKYHDIPNTVARAVCAAADLGVWMLNVHALGGENMLLAARDALAKYTAPPLLVAVTILTSLSASDLPRIGIASTLPEQILSLARLAKNCALDGVVCSAQESALLRAELGADFALVTPGIRIAGDAPQDQKRILTPAAAIASGSDYLVIGRSITQSQNPIALIDEIIASLPTT